MDVRLIIYCQPDPEDSLAIVFVGQLPRFYLGPDEELQAMIEAILGDQCIFEVLNVSVDELDEAQEKRMYVVCAVDEDTVISTFGDEPLKSIAEVHQSMEDDIDMLALSLSPSKGKTLLGRLTGDIL